MLWHALSKQHPIVADTMAVVFHSSTPSPSGDGCQPMHVACNLQAALYTIACTTLGLMGAGLPPEAMLNYVQQSRVLLKQLKACNTADQWSLHTHFGNRCLLSSRIVFFCCLRRGLHSSFNLLSAAQGVILHLSVMCVSCCVVLLPSACTGGDCNRGGQVLLNRKRSH